MVKKIGYQWIVLVIAMAVFACLFEFIYVRVIYKSEAIKGDLVSADQKIISYNELRKTKNSLITTSNDSYFVLDTSSIRKNIEGIQLVMDADLVHYKDNQIQVYWSYENRNFAENCSTKKIIKSNQYVINIFFEPGMYDSLRVDLGQYTNEEFPIQNVSLWVGNEGKYYIYGNISFFRIICWFICGLSASLLLIGIIKKRKVGYIVFFSLLTTGILYGIVLPPYSAPDEERHIITVYQYTSDLLHTNKEDHPDHVVLHQSDAISDATIYYTPNKATYKSIYCDTGKYDKYFKLENLVSVQKKVDARSILYFPQIIGVLIGRIFHLSWWHLLITGRFFALLFYSGCMAFAVSRLPKGKNLFFAVSLLPIMMELAVSFSYDCTLLGFSTVYISYIVYTAFKKEISKSDWIRLVLFAGLFSFSKLVYFPVHGLLFLIPLMKQHKKSGIKNWLYIWITIGIAFAVAFIQYLPAMIHIFSPHASGLAPETSDYIVSDFIKEPGKLINIYWNTFLIYLDAYTQSMLGGSLGWLEIRLPWTMLLVFVIFIAVSIMEDSDQEPWFDFKQKLWIFFLCLVMYLLVYASMLFLWTPNTSDVIIGVQGRYFLPFLALLASIFIKRKQERPTTGNISFKLLNLQLIQSVFVILKVLNITLNR